MIKNTLKTVGKVVYAMLDFVLFVLMMALLILIGILAPLTPTGEKDALIYTTQTNPPIYIYEGAVNGREVHYASKVKR